MLLLVQRWLWRLQLLQLWRLLELYRCCKTCARCPLLKRRLHCVLTAWLSMLQRLLVLCGQHRHQLLLLLLLSVWQGVAVLQGSWLKGFSAFQDRTITTHP